MQPPPPEVSGLYEAMSRQATRGDVPFKLKETRVITSMYMS